MCGGECVELCMGCVWGMFVVGLRGLWAVCGGDVCGLCMGVCGGCIWGCVGLWAVGGGCGWCIAE